LENKNLNILILLTETPQEFKAYLDKLSAQLYTRDQYKTEIKLTHIVVQGEEQAKQAEKDFLTNKNAIKILCLSQVKDIKGYLLSNGRFAMEPGLVDTKVGEYLLNKFFSENHNIHLDESFGESFQNFEKYEVVNHLNTGELIDEISLDAFDKGFNIVSLRSYLDHAIIYLTYLKQAGLSGIPFELEVSNNEDFYAVNIHAPVKNFTAEYMMDAFGNVNSKDPLQYILAIVNRSTDFLDITYIENPARIVMTGFWNKSKKKLNGLSFNNVLTSTQMMAQVEKKIRDYKPEVEKEIEVEAKKEELKPKSLPGSILEMVMTKDENSFLNKEPQKAASLIAFAIDEYQDKYPDRSINEIDQEDLNEIISGFPDEELIESLNVEDQENLLDRIQKKNITEAYDEELERVRSSLEDEEEYIEELSDTLNEEVVNRVTGSLDAETLNRILGDKDEDDFSQTVSGGKQEKDDFKLKISATKDDKKGDLVTRVSGSFESKAGEFNVKFNNSSPEDKKKGMFDFVTSSVASVKEDVSIDLKVRQYFTKNSPKKIQKGLENYALQKGLNLEDLSQDDLIEFKNDYLPEVVESVLEDEAAIEDFASSLEKPIDRSNQLQNNNSAEFKDKFKTRLEETLANVKSVSKDGDKYVVNDDNMSESEMQDAIKQTMKQTFSEEFKLDKANKAEIEKKEQEIIENLSFTLNMPKEEVAKIVKGASQVAKDKESQKVVDNIFQTKPGDKEQDDNTTQVVSASKETEISDENESTVVKASPDVQRDSQSLIETQLLSKIKKIEEENKKLQKQLQAQDMNNDVKEQVDQKKKEVEDAVTDKLNEELKNTPTSKEQEEIQKIESNLKETQEIVGKVKSGAALTNEEALRLAQAVENEKVLIENAKKAELENRKMAIEAQQKDSLFNSEITKATKALKAKDVVVDKLKESMQNIVGKKDRQLAEYKAQVESMNQRLNNDEASTLKVEMKGLKLDLSTQEKMVEVYKNKLENLVKSQEAKKGKDDSAQIQAENRSLQRIKTQLENQYNSEVKQKRSLEERYNKAKEMETKLRSKAMNAEASLKNAENANKQLNDQAMRLSKLLEKMKASGGADSKSQKEVELLKKQKEQLQAKLTQMAKSNSSGGDSDKELIQLKDQNKVLQAKLAKLSGSEVSADVTKELEQVKAQNQQLQDKLSKTAGDAVNPESLKELESVKAQNQQLQSKISELNEKLTAPVHNKPDPNAQSTNEKRLEQNVKKLNTELSKAKNEVAESKKLLQKMKQEKVATSNKMQLLAKELDKFKKAKGKKAA